MTDPIVDVEKHETLSDERIVHDVVVHLRDALVLLGMHSAKVDYHKQIIKMAVRDLSSGAKMLEHLLGPTPQPYRSPPEQGPGFLESGPKRFKVTVKLARPAIYRGKDTRGEEVEVEWDETQTKKIERPKFYNSAFKAELEVKVWCFHIGEMVESVRLLDRLNKVLWTYDNEGNCAELQMEEESDG